MNNFILAICSAIVYALTQYIEKKFVKKETFEPRIALKSTALVFVSVMCGMFLYEQLDLDAIADNTGSVVESMKGSSSAAQVFTDNPSF